VEQSVFSFIKKYYDPSKPVLLALSGGPDSLALYTLLLKYRETQPLKLAIAHVDHGWRKESGEEAQILQNMALKNENRFHLKKLNPPEKQQTNLEATAREERLKFYSELCIEHGYQAVLLAHHADDQAETVLKRIFEGASLPYLCGLRECTQVQGLTLWRPLLNVDKKTILEWLHQQGLNGFVDQTNLNPKFLRGKFRTHIIPNLSTDFGKDVGRSLGRLGAEAGKLREYLEQRMMPFIDRIERGKLGIFLDLSQQIPQYPIELDYLLRKFCEGEGLSLSRDNLKTAQQLILAKSGNKKISLGSKFLIIDRGRLFLPGRHFEQELPELPLKSGIFAYGYWKVRVEEETRQEKGGISGWKAAWDGFCSVYLPWGNYTLAPPQLTPSLSKWWTNAKIPAFMRHQIPVIWENQQIRYEFLTGKKIKQDIETNKWLKISLDL
jgi:tRNA(Ile)-lysidine synthase